MARVRRDLVVVGGSAGGVAALKHFVGALPADLPAAVVVMLHLASDSPSLLPGILQRHSAIRVVTATDAAVLETATVYVAEPDSDTTVDGGRLRLGSGARARGHRPSLDALLASAARSRGPRVVGVVLTGMLDDGSAGLRAVAGSGGVPLVQHPDDAEFPAMPRSALAAVPHARALPLDALADEVVALVSEPLPDGADAGPSGAPGPAGGPGVPASRPRPGDRPRESGTEAEPRPAAPVPGGGIGPVRTGTGPEPRRPDLLRAPPRQHRAATSGRGPAVDAPHGARGRLRSGATGS